jgi:hypothetical protein
MMCFQKVVNNYNTLSALCPTNHKNGDTDMVRFEMGVGCSYYDRICYAIEMMGRIQTISEIL